MKRPKHETASLSNTVQWLLLIHQLPAKPAYVRVKLWRRLAEIGAVAIKNAVHALPASEQTQEDFEWLLREIAAAGGEAIICEARFIDGLSDPEVRALFEQVRDADYHELAKEIRPLAEQLNTGALQAADDRAGLQAQVKRWRKRFEEIVAIDFFGANDREPVEGLLTDLENRLRESDSEAMPAGETEQAESLTDRVWVTRQGVHVDRIACSWLIRRFIDPNARFKFVPGKGYRPEPGELRFDMFEAEFTHEGDRCSFETLLLRRGIKDLALQAIAEIVHDIDMKDAKFGREDAVGISRLIAGIAMASKDDAERVARGNAVFDDLYAYFRKKRR
jgi:hypothetical protein